MRRIPPTWFYSAAAAIGAGGALPFADFDGAMVFDPDLRIDDLLVYHAFFSSWSLDLLTPPAPNVYFEGHSLIYGLALHLYRAIAGLVGASPPLREAAIATVSIVGALAHMAATVVFFAAARRLTQNAIAALVLTLLFGLSPQILAIDLIRIDRLMILPLMVVLYISVLMTRREATARHGAVLGLAMAVLASTKITGALFGVLPVLAAGSVLLLAKEQVWPQVRTIIIAAVATGAPAFLLVMIRHVLHWDRFVPSLAEGYAMQMKWTGVLPSTPVLYYNVDLFAGYGVVFLVLVAASVVVLAVRAVSDREATSLWLLVALAMFSAAGMAVFKYDRGGYHLVPLYLFALAIGLRCAMDVFAGRLRGRRSLGELAAAAAVLLVPAAAVGETYVSQTSEARRREASAIITRIDSREWILARFAPGDRICMMTSSQWANPPLAGHGLQVTTAPFDIPYLDATAMSDYMPPRLYQVRAACDAVVLNDLHTTVYLDNFTTRGYVARRAEWDRFLADLRTAYPPKIFAGDVKAFFVSQVEVFDLRDGSSAAVPSRAEILAGAFHGDGFTFAGHRIPLETDGFAGAVDTAARYGADIGIEGWAVDTRRQQPVAGIILVADGKIVGFGGAGTVRRPDVAAAFDIPDYQLAGVAACTSSPAARVRVFAVGQDGALGELTPSDGVAVAAAPAGVQAPYPCRSFEGP